MALPVIAVLLLVVVILMWWKTKKPKGFPPGPYSWPVLGNVMELFVLDKTRTRHVRLQETLKKYGPVVGMHVLDQMIVWVADYKIIKEAFRRSDLSGRPDRYLTRMLTGENYKEPPHTRGVLFSSGKNWEEHRRFSHKTLKNFGLGKVTSEMLVHEEAEVMIKELCRHHGKAMFMDGDVFAISILNITWAIVSGKRYKHDDARLLHIAGALKKHSTICLPFSIQGQLPWLLKAFPKWTGLQEFNEVNESIHNVIREEIEEHKARLDPNDPKDFLDMYLLELQKPDCPPSFSEQELVILCSDFFMAGLETTSTTMLWAILLMGLHPDVQEKVHQEVLSVMGMDILPAMSDRTKLPYTEAVLSEIQRVGSIVPIGLPHVANKDTEVAGYFMPKDTVIFSCLYAVHHDPLHWEDPNVFRPERFLSPDGSTYVHNDHLIPFSIGKRVCLGESLARIELWQFFTALMQRLCFSVPEGIQVQEHRMEGVTCSPKAYHMLVHDRKILMNYYNVNNS